MAACVTEALDRGAARARGLAWWKWALGPWMAGVILAAFLYVGSTKGFPGGGESPRIVFFHVPLAILLFLWYIVAAWHSVRFLWKGDLASDTKAAAAAEVGLLCTVIATISGSVFARAQWGAWWHWDPKQTAIVVVMFLYGAYFALREGVQDEERRARLAAVYAILGAIATPFVVMGAQYLPGTHHPEGVITQREGMSPDYRMVFWASTLGFLGITVWLYQLRLRLAAARAALEERRAGD